MFLDTLKLFVFEFQVLNNYFTGQLPLNAFTCYFENFLHVTKNIVNSQVIPLQALFWLLCSLCQKKCQTYFLSYFLTYKSCSLYIDELFKSQIMQGTNCETAGGNESRKVNISNSKVHKA